MAIQTAWIFFYIYFQSLVTEQKGFKYNFLPNTPIRHTHRRSRISLNIHCDVIVPKVLPLPED